FLVTEFDEEMESLNIFDREVLKAKIKEEVMCARSTLDGFEFSKDVVNRTIDHLNFIKELLTIIFKKEYLSIRVEEVEGDIDLLFNGCVFSTNLEDESGSECEKTKPWKNRPKEFSNNEANLGDDSFGEDSNTNDESDKDLEKDNSGVQVNDKTPASPRGKTAHAQENYTMKKLKQTLCEIDLRAKYVPLSDVDIKLRIKTSKELLNVDHLRFKDLRQRAKCSWALEEDENSKFFHGVINSKRNRSRINGLNIQSLVPKVDEPVSLNNYRPISLIGCQYKIIAKLLANRLVKIISSVVSEVQMAFIKGRQIIDGPLM
nr:cysteine-rich receptor-like protein kinase [Tanacetum cinerariifolium]